MPELFAAFVIALAGIYCILLGGTCLVWPTRAKSFLRGFAATARAHYLEMLVRLLVGSALVIRSSDMLFGQAFRVFGWVILISTVVLVLLPWTWHQRFAQKVVPPAVRHMPWLGLVAILLGCALLAAVAES